MSSPKSIMDDLLLKDQEFNDLMFDFEKNLIACQPERKSNSLNDLKPPPKQYRNVESKVKSYIASLPAPASGRRKTFKKHTSMPGYVGDSMTHGTSDSSIINRLEQEFSDYRRQSEHTISEMQKQNNVYMVMYAKATNENSDLMDKIMHMQNSIMLQDIHNPTPETLPPRPPVGTPKKAIPKKRLVHQDDTAGSFIGQTVPADETTTNMTVATIVPVTAAAQLECTPKGKRNLSFSSTGDVTRRSGGTDSGINTSDENEIHIQAGPMDNTAASELRSTPLPVKRKKFKRFLTRLVCCGAVSSSSSSSVVKARKAQKISYKKM